MVRRCVLVAALAAGAAIAQTGSISGRVVGESGARAVGAVVRYDKIRTFQRDAGGRMIPVGPAVNLSVQTGHDGAFVITRLPAGEYYLCALASRPGELNSCEWENEPTPISVVPGQQVQNVLLTIRSGAVIRIRVDDPAGKLRDDSDFIAGFMADSGHYSRAHSASPRLTAREYVVTIPRDVSGRLFIDSRHPITDEAGKIVAVREPSLPVAAGAQRELVFSLRVQ